MIEKRSALRGLQHFAYDAEQRLIEVRNENGSGVKMTYDPLGRRIAETEHDSRGNTLGQTPFGWDGLRLLQEHKHSQTNLYIYGGKGDSAVLVRPKSSTYRWSCIISTFLNGLGQTLLTENGT